MRTPSIGTPPIVRNAHTGRAGPFGPAASPFGPQPPPGSTRRASGRASAGGTPALPRSQQAIGAAVRADAWAATPAISSRASTSSSVGGSAPSAAANEDSHSVASILHCLVSAAVGERRRYRNVAFDSARWEALDLRDDDIVISTSPKCGTTWMQMMCALLVFGTPDLPAPLAVLSPWVDMLTRPLDEVVRDLEGQRHRRFLKTHTPLDGLPFDPSVTYLHVARDPRDVALSWDNHFSNMDLGRFIGARVAAVGGDDLAELLPTGADMVMPADDPAARFWQWVEDATLMGDVSGLRAMVHHSLTFWERRHEPNVYLFHYGDLRADLPVEMARLAGVLGYGTPSHELVDAATFEAMRARADELIPNSDTPFWRDNARFFDKGRSGAWRELLDEEGERRYERSVAPLGPPELLAWLHGGGPVT